MDLKKIAHDVALESGMAHESLSALTAVIQEGIDRALAAFGEPDGLETTAGEREVWRSSIASNIKDGRLSGGHALRLLRDFDRLLAREAKAREVERSVIETRIDQLIADAPWMTEPTDQQRAFVNGLHAAKDAVIARSKP